MNELDFYWDPEVKKTAERTSQQDDKALQRDLNDYFDYLLDVNPVDDGSRPSPVLFTDKFTL